MATKKKTAKKKPQKRELDFTDRALLAAAEEGWERIEDARSPGRPTDYREEYVDEAYKQCLLGATDEELAQYFGVVRSTISAWKNQYPDFSDAIANGKDRADANVAHAVYKRATGAERIEQEAIKLKEVIYDAGKRVKETERVEVVDVLRVDPPDTTAGKFWLINRRRRSWKDKIDTEISASEDLAEIIVGLAKNRPPGIEQ